MNRRLDHSHLRLLQSVDATGGVGTANGRTIRRAVELGLIVPVDRTGPPRSWYWALTPAGARAVAPVVTVDEPTTRFPWLRSLRRYD